MLVSLIVFLPAKIKTVLKQVSEIDYSKGRMEVIFCGKGVLPAKFEGPPLIRMIPSKDINCILKISHGDILYIIEPGKIPPDIITKHEGYNEQVVSFGKNYYIIPKRFAFPDDTKCLRTATYMQALFGKFQILGNPGRLNRTEILRLIYRHKELTGWQKINLVWRWVCGF